MVETGPVFLIIIFFSLPTVLYMLLSRERNPSPDRKNEKTNQGT